MNRQSPEPTRVLRFASIGALCVAAVAMLGRDLTAQVPERLTQVEARLAKVEAQLEAMTDLLKQIVKPKSSESLMRDDLLTSEPGVSGSFGFSILQASESLTKALAEQKRLTRQVQRTRALFEQDQVNKEQLLQEEEALGALEPRIRLFKTVLRRERETQRMALRALEVELERKRALAESAVIPQLEVLQVEARVAEQRNRLAMLDEVIQQTISKKEPEGQGTAFEDLGVVAFLDKGGPIVSFLSMDAVVKAQSPDGFEFFLIDRDEKGIATIEGLEFETTGPGTVCRVTTGEIGTRSPQIGDRLVRVKTDRKKPRRYRDAAINKARNDTKAIYGAARIFKMKERRLPAIADLTKTDAKGRSYLQGPLKDAWGHDYVIIDAGEGRISVLSKGPDGKRGTADDIVYPQKND